MSPRTRSILIGAGCTFVVAGIVSWFVLHQRRPPPPKRITATITTPLAKPEEAEREIASKAEESVAGLEGVAHVDSRSTAGTVTLNVTLEPSADLTAAALSLNAALGKSQNTFPPGAWLGPMTKVSQSVRLVVRGEIPADDFVRSSIRPALDVLPGVTAIRECGTREPLVAITLDPQKLAALALDPTSIAPQLRGTDLSSLDDLRLLRVGATAQGTIRLGDVATIEKDEVPSECRAYDENGSRPSLDVGIVDPSVIPAIERVNLTLPKTVTLEPFDPARVTTITAEVTRGAAPTPAELDDWGRRIAKAAKVMPEAKEVLVVHDPASPRDVDFVVRIALRPGVGTVQGREQLARALRTLPGVDVATTDRETLPSVIVLGPELGQLRKLATDARTALLGTDGVRGAIVVGAVELPATVVDPDRSAVVRYGSDPQTVAALVKLATVGEWVGGRTPGRIFLGQKRTVPEVLAIAIATKAGNVPLSQLVTARNEAEPAAILRFDRERGVKLDVDTVAPMSDAALLSAVKDLRLPPGYRVIAR